MTIAGMSLGTSLATTVGATSAAANAADSSDGSDTNGSPGFSDALVAARRVAAAVHRHAGKVTSAPRGRSAAATDAAGNHEAAMSSASRAETTAGASKYAGPTTDDAEVAAGQGEQEEDAVSDSSVTSAATAAPAPAPRSGAGVKAGFREADLDADPRDRTHRKQDGTDDASVSGRIDAASATVVPLPATVASAAAFPAPRTDSRQGGTRGGKEDAGNRATAANTDAPAASSPSTTGATSPATVPAQSLPDARVAPVLAALAEAANGAQAPAANDTMPPAQGVQVAAAQQDAAMPATAAMLSARMPVTRDAAPDKGTAEPRKSAKGDTASPFTQAAALSDPTHVATDSGPATGAAPDAGATLAAQGADRQLDLAKQGAWLDSLSRDIASAGTAAGGTMRFQVSPQHLGTVQVEMTQTADGAASLVLTAASEASRALLSDARPQLIADARAHGLHIASAEIGVVANAQAASSDSQAQNGQPQADSRHHAPASSQDAAQNGGQGANGGGSQTRSQPIAPTTDADGRPPQAAQEVDAPDAPAPDDGLYA